MSVIVCVAILGQIALFSGSATGWTYDDQEDWPSSCKGSLQSPIPLSIHTVKEHVFENDIQFDPSTYESHNATVTNTGHTVEVRFPNGTQRPTISGGGLQGVYVLEAFHFHWLSEHALNGHRFPLEGHFVYYSDQYEDFNTALQNKNGIAVLAVFYKVNPRSNPGFRFVKDVPLVAHTIGEPVPTHHRVTLMSLLPLFSNKFYRYDGSLTTPNCNEVVIWTIFAAPSYISDHQLKGLKEIYDENGNPLEANYRELQEINARRVLFHL